MRTTPMRDAIRGRLTGRLDVRGAIEQSGLPASLQLAIRRTMSKTRFMWRLERADIARELIRHFQDAIEDGADPEDIAEKFGDPVAAGRLIRRATKRKRPLPWQLARLTLLGAAWTIGLAIVLYLFQAARVFGTSPRIAVDYRIELNEHSSAIPDDQRAWPLYREALIGLPRITPENFYNRWPRPGETGWSDVEQFLSEHSAQLETVRRATELSGLGFVVGYEFTEADLELWPDYRDYDDAQFHESGMIGIMLPYLSDMRRLAKVLQIDAIHRAAKGDGAGAKADLEAMLAMAQHTRELPILINDLVGLSIAALSFEILGELISNDAALFTDDDLKSLAHLLGAMDESSLAVRLNGERMMFEDILQRTYSDDGNGNGFLTAEGFQVLQSMMGFSSISAPLDMPDLAFGASVPVLSAVVIDRRTAQAEYDRFMNLVFAISEQPAWDRDTGPISGMISEWSTTPLDRLRNLPLVTLVPPLSRLAWQLDVTMMRRDGVLAALAAELHRRHHGEWPQSIDDMVPLLIPMAPIDRMNGEPVRLTVQDGRLIVYSVGSDQEDDGGARDEPWWAGYASQPIAQLNPNSTEAARHREQTRDWVLWPPLLEELKPYEN